MKKLDKVIQFLASFRLASILLLLLMALTWFGTLEQVDHGLYNTIQKYFTWKNFIVLPDITINGKLLPIPLPGAYWVSALLFFNMLLGGVIKMKKTPKKAGIFISHLGILLLLLGGFVTHHFSKRGNMALYEGETADYAQSYHDHSIEISELNEAGEVINVSVIPHSILQKVRKSGATAQAITHSTLPFSFEISHYLKNCRPRRVGPVAAGGTPSVDGYALFETELNKADEANLNGCYVKTSTGEDFLLFSGAFAPYILKHEGTNYSIALRKAIWKMPFEVHLKDFNVEFFPTGKPKKFESYVTRTENSLNEEVKIYMNHPMRHNGFTFFQASWGPQEGGLNQRLYSVFEVVKNPADQWPFYSIVVTSFGLIGHFAFMLGSYIYRQTTSKKK